MNIAMPPTVEVSPVVNTADYYDQYSNGLADPTTGLFRYDTGLNLALGMTMDGAHSRGSIAVISAGCSFGPEADTVSSLMFRNSPGIRLNMLGLDINRSLLVAARSGQYVLKDIVSDPREIYGAAGLVFEDEMNSQGIYLEHSRGGAVTKLNMRLHRLGQTFLFLKHDLREDLPGNKLADLILCNNVLNYFNPVEARQIVNNLATRLAVNGVASFGRNNIGDKNSAYNVFFTELLSDMSDELNSRGIEQITPDEVPGLYAIQRKS